jgi:tRNA A37 threonylcarbamoyladenosine modification protein TsaB
VAKALTWQRGIEWRVASSLLVRAAGHAPAAGGVVLALSDALRGELYAGYWRVYATGVVQLGLPPRALRPDALIPGADVVVGTIPAPLIAAVTQATGRVPITGEAALPDARTLLALADRHDGTVLVTDPANWQPEYGRPAEAQAVWERNHGREFPAAASVAR